MYNENVMVVTSEVKSKSTHFDIRKMLYRGVKRGMDIVLSLVGLIVLSPLLVIVAILIKLDSKGPVFIDQKRIGKDGKLFKIFKFRSMVDHGEEILEKLMMYSPAIREEYLQNKKLANDPRITRIGAFIRKTSIDELPQLINVLIGNMTLVGPRPYLPREKKDMGIDYLTISRMTPGLTGPWQVGGRSNTSFEDRCMLDVDYYINRSLSLDLSILLKTVQVVFKKNGAK